MLHALPLLVIALCVAAIILAELWPLIGSFFRIGITDRSVSERAAYWVTIVFPIIAFCLCWYVVLSQQYDAWSVGGAFMVLGYVVRGWLQQFSRQAKAKTKQ